MGGAGPRGVARHRLPAAGPPPGKQKDDAMTLQAGIQQGDGRPPWSRRAVLYIGVLSIAESVRTCVWLPRVLLHSAPWPPRHDLTWLLTLGLPWRAWSLLDGLCLIGWAVGTAALGAGLLLRRTRPIAVGLIAIAPWTATGLLYIPGHLAVLLGRAAPGVPSDVPLSGLRTALILQASGGLTGSVLAAAYLWWVWRTYRRMQGEIRPAGGPGRSVRDAT